MKKISLIIPAKNEKESLEAVLSEIENNPYVNEKILVVDSNEDNSIPIAKKFNCKIIIQKKRGYGSAIIEGFENAKSEYGCIFNADYSFDPKYFNELIQISKNYDFVFGTRYTKNSGSDDDDMVTLIGNKIFSFITRYFLRIKLSDILFTYVLCNVDSFKKLALKNDDFKLCIELPVKIKFNNLSYTELSMKERKRFGGQKKVNALIDGLYILIEIIKVLNTLLAQNKLFMAIPFFSIDLSNKEFFKIIKDFFLPINLDKSQKEINLLLNERFKNRYINVLPSARLGFYLTLKKNLKEGDEIIFSSMSFPLYLKIASELKLKIKLVDVDSDTMNINHELLEKKISQNTKCIVVTHLFGYPCKIDEIKKITKKNNILITEDCAQS